MESRGNGLAPPDSQSDAELAIPATGDFDVKAWINDAIARRMQDEHTKGTSVDAASSAAATLLARLGVESSDMLKRSMAIQVDVTSKLLPRAVAEIQTVARDAARVRRDFTTLRALLDRAGVQAQAQAHMFEDEDVPRAVEVEGGTTLNGVGDAHPQIKIAVVDAEHVVDNAHAGDGRAAPKDGEPRGVLGADLRKLHTARLNLVSTLDSLRRAQRWSLLPNDARALAAEGDWERAADKIQELHDMVGGGAGESLDPDDGAAERPRRALLASLTHTLLTSILPSVLAGASSSHPDTTTLARAAAIAARLNQPHWFASHYAAGRVAQTVNEWRAALDACAPDAVAQGLKNLQALVEQESARVNGSAQDGLFVVSADELVAAAVESVKEPLDGWVRARVADLEQNAASRGRLKAEVARETSWPELAEAVGAMDVFVQAVEQISQKDTHAATSPNLEAASQLATWSSTLLSTVHVVRTQMGTLEKSHLSSRLAKLPLLTPALTLFNRARALPARIDAATAEVRRVPHRLYLVARGRQPQLSADAAAWLLAESVSVVDELVVDVTKELDKVAAGGAEGVDLVGSPAFMAVVAVVLALKDMDRGVSDVERDLNRVAKEGCVSVDGGVGIQLDQLFGASPSAAPTLQLLSARDASARCVRMAHGAILTALSVSLDSNISAFAGMPLWTPTPVGSSQSTATGAGASFSFSLTPSTAVTRLGEHLLALPQLLVSLAESPNEGSVLAHKCAELPHLDQTERDEIKQGEDDETGVDPALVARVWLSSVVRRGIMKIVDVAVAAVAGPGRGVGTFGERAAKQLATDAGYLGNVVAALDVEIGPALEAIEGACSESEEVVQRTWEVLNGATGSKEEESQRIFEKLCRVRGVRFGPGDSGSI